MSGPAHSLLSLSLSLSLSSDQSSTFSQQVSGPLLSSSKPVGWFSAESTGLSRKYLLPTLSSARKSETKCQKHKGFGLHCCWNAKSGNFASFSWEVVTRWLEINLEFSGAWEGGDRSTEMVYQGLLWLESWIHANWCCVCWCLLHNIGWGAHRVEEGEQKRFANVMVHISYLSSVRAWLSPAVVLPWNWLCPPGDIFGCYK